MQLLSASVKPNMVLPPIGRLPSCFGPRVGTSRCFAFRVRLATRSTASVEGAFFRSVDGEDQGHGWQGIHQDALVVIPPQAGLNRAFQRWLKRWLDVDGGGETMEQARLVFFHLHGVEHMAFAKVPVERCAALLALHV